MAEIEFTCPECQGSLTVDEADGGQEAPCPLCGKDITIPTISKPVGRHTKPCPFCGEQIALSAIKCKHCGKFLSGESEQAKPPQQMAPSKGGGFLNPKLNAGGWWGALIGGVIPSIILIVSDKSYSDNNGRLIVLCLVVGALVGNYLWGMRGNRAAAGKVKGFFSFVVNLIGLCVLSILVWGAISRFTGGELRQKKEAARRVLREAGQPVTPEAISNIVKKIDWVEECERIRKAAEDGDAKAQSILGGMYADGNGVPQDLAKAVQWMRKSADQGHAMAQYNLAAAYIAGLGVSQDQVESAKWMRKAAEQGVADAQYSYGVMSFKGMGVKLDLSESVKWIRKAAEQGVAAAESDLGDAYLNGNGVPQDDAEAVKWFRKAAEQGYAMAQNNLGAMYDNGRGVPLDDIKAVEWYRKAADQGYASAQFNLGVMYDNGEGVAKNAATAKKWLRKAAEQGHVGAQESLDSYDR